jgi:phosphohistidine phosphatase
MPRWISGCAFFCGLDLRRIPAHLHFMELYLLRHGIAVERGLETYHNDSHRPLTPAGLKRTRKVARALAGWADRFDVVLTSPYVRAKQTADIVVEILGLPQKLRLSNALVPGARPRDLVADIRRHAEEDARVLLVGHEPGMSRFASLLISGRADADLTLKKAGLCVLDTGDLVAGRCASLELLLPPRLLLRMPR